MKRFISLLTAIVFIILAIPAVSAETSLLTADKTEYEVGEAIMVTATGSGKDWVGIYYPDGKNSLYWAYIDANADKGVGSGVAFDITHAPNKNGSAPATLPAGEYIIRLMPNDTSDLSLALATINITIKPTAAEDFNVSGGDLTKLNVPKTVYKYTEQINISAIGSGKDWVGIYYPDATRSLYWAYIDKNASKGIGSGVEFDIENAPNMNSGTPSELPAGNYIIRLMPDDTSDLSRAVAWVGITILPLDPSEIKDPVKPVSAEYKLANDTDGYSEGKLTVKIAPDNSAKDIVCYWADANGKLPGYTALAKFKIKGETTVFDFPASTLIPAGATKLLVYTALNGILSEDFVEIALPEGAASKPQGKPLYEFQVVSDVHIDPTASHRNNKHYEAMLKDIVAVSPESRGLFIVGDIANKGAKTEWLMFDKLHNSVAGAPKYYLALGNHDLYNGDYNEKIAEFLKYAKLPDGKNAESCHYDFWLEGFHYVFIGNDRMIDGVRATLNNDTLEWLDQTLAQDRVEGRPTFVFMHQSIYNTVAGSLPGQGWDGVESPAKLKNILKKYPEVILFNGHSHWTLDSESCMYKPKTDLPINIFNTASVAYLWTSYDITAGENLEGSQGYYVRVYEDRIEVLGRDFVSGEWVSSAQFVVEYGIKPEESDETTAEITVDETQNIETDESTEKVDSGCGSTVSAAALLALLAATAVILKKKH